MKYINLISCMLASTFPLLAFAEDFDSPLDSIKETMAKSVISLDKIPTYVNKVPITAYVISQSEIARKGYRHLSDILKNTPGIHLINLAHSETEVTEIYIFGVLANNKMAILRDGIKIKPPTGEYVTFFESIPLFELQQVEISFGATSSVYGADAMLATINLVTLDSEKINGVQVKATGGTVDTGEVQLVAGTKISTDFSAMLSGSFHRSAKEDLAANYPAIYGNVGAVDLTEQNHNVDFKLNYKNLTLSYYRLYNKNNTSVVFKPTAPYLYDYSGASFWENLNQTANATYLDRLGDDWQTKTSLSYERNEILPQSAYQGYGLAPEYRASLGEAIRFTQHAMYDYGDIRWLSGIEFSFLTATPKYYVTASPASRVHVSYQNYAAFSQVDYAWNKDLSLTGSIRMDADSRFRPIFNPRVGFSWQALTTLRFFGAWGTSYLAPSPAAAYQSWTSADGTASTIPNPKLRPEKINTSELGADFIPTKNTQLKLTGFYTTGVDLIRQAGNIYHSSTFFVSQNQNIAQSTTYGMQAFARAKFDSGVDMNLAYNLTLGKQSAENTIEGLVGITNTPRHQIKANVEYHLEDLTVRFTERWFNTVGTHQSNSLYFGKNAPGGLVLDSNIHYGGQLNATKWSVDLGVDNLLDKKYYAISRADNANYVLPRAPQETRKFYLTLGVSF